MYTGEYLIGVCLEESNTEDVAMGKLREESSF